MPRRQKSSDQILYVSPFLAPVGARLDGEALYQCWPAFFEEYHGLFRSAENNFRELKLSGHTMELFPSRRLFEGEPLALFACSDQEILQKALQKFKEVLIFPEETPAVEDETVLQIRNPLNKGLELVQTLNKEYSSLTFGDVLSEFSWRSHRARIEFVSSRQLRVWVPRSLFSWVSYFLDQKIVTPMKVDLVCFDADAPEGLASMTLVLTILSSLFLCQEQKKDLIISFSLHPAECIFPLELTVVSFFNTQGHVLYYHLYLQLRSRWVPSLFLVEYFLQRYAQLSLMQDIEILEVKAPSLRIELPFLIDDFSTLLAGFFQEHIAHLAWRKKESSLRYRFNRLAMEHETSSRFQSARTLKAFSELTDADRKITAYALMHEKKSNDTLWHRHSVLSSVVLPHFFLPLLSPFVLREKEINLFLSPNQHLTWYYWQELATRQGFSLKIVRELSQKAQENYGIPSEMLVEAFLLNSCVNLPQQRDEDISCLCFMDLRWSPLKQELSFEHIDFYYSHGSLAHYSLELERAKTLAWKILRASVFFAHLHYENFSRNFRLHIGKDSIYSSFYGLRPGFMGALRQTLSSIEVFHA